MSCYIDITEGSNMVFCLVYGEMQGGYVGGIVCDIGPMLFKIDGCKNFAKTYASEKGIMPCLQLVKLLAEKKFMVSR